MSSLQGKLGAALIGSLVVLFVLQWIAASVVLRSVTEEQAAERLQQTAETLLAAFVVGSDGDLTIETRYIAPIYLRPFSGQYYVVLTPRNTIASRSLWDTELPVQPIATGEVVVRSLPGPQRQRVLMRTAGYQKLGRTVTIAVAEDLSDFDRSLARFRMGHAIISAAVLLLLILAQYWIVRRGMSSLTRLREDLARLERGEIDAIGTEVPDEISPLVGELNRLLLVLRQRVRRSRDALGNLAHALKTQLALLVHAGEDEALAGHADLRERLTAPLSRIQALTDRELRRARLAGGGMPGQHVGIEAELQRLIGAIRAIYADKSLQIELDVANAAQFYGDTEDFVELAGNLLDNAAKYCRSTIHIKVRTTAGLSLSVEDDGPGYEADDSRVVDGARCTCGRIHARRRAGIGHCTRHRGGLRRRAAAWTLRQPGRISRGSLAADGRTADVNRSHQRARFCDPF